MEKYYKYILTGYTMFFWTILIPIGSVMAQSEIEVKCFDGDYTKSNCIQAPYIWNDFMYGILVFYDIHLLIANLLCLYLVLKWLLKPQTLTIEITSSPAL